MELKTTPIGIAARQEPLRIASQLIPRQDGQSRQILGGVKIARTETVLVHDLPIIRNRLVRMRDHGSDSPILDRLDCGQGPIGKPGFGG